MILKNYYQKTELWCHECYNRWWFVLQLFLADFLKECDEMSYIFDTFSLENYFSPDAVYLFRQFWWFDGNTECSFYFFAILNYFHFSLVWQVYLYFNPFFSIWIVMTSFDSHSALKAVLRWNVCKRKHCVIFNLKLPSTTYMMYNRQKLFIRWLVGS